MSSSIKQVFHGLRKHLSGAAYLIVQPLVLNAISLPVTAYIIRSLGATGYGDWVTASTLIATFAFLTNLGLRMYFVRSVSQDHEIAQVALLEQLGVRILLASAAAVIGIAVCAALRYPIIVLECAAFSALALVFATVQTAFADLLQALGRLRALATINLIAGLALTAASVVVALRNWGPLALSGAYLTGPMLGVLVGCWYVRSRLFHVTISWHLGRLLQIVWHSRVLGLQLFADVVGNQAEALLVPKLAGIAMYGYFAVGTILPNRLSVVYDGLSTAFYPVMARNHKIGPAPLIRTCLMYFAAAVGLCVPVAVVTKLIARPLSALLFPHHAEICRYVMELTIWVLPINAVAAVMGYTLNACGREKAECKAVLLSNICGVIIAVTLTAKFGLVGACWSLLTRNTIAVIARSVPFVQLIYPMIRGLAKHEPAQPPAPEPVAAPD